MIEPTYQYAATVVKVIDGDTVDFLVDLGMYTYKQIRTRLLGINAPETWTEEGKLARFFLQDYMPIGSSCVIRTYKHPGDKYGRWLALIYCEGETRSVNQMMIDTGHAVESAV